MRTICKINKKWPVRLPVFAAAYLNKKTDNDVVYDTFPDRIMREDYERLPRHGALLYRINVLPKRQG